MTDNSTMIDLSKSEITRYSDSGEDGIIEKLFVEAGKRDNADTDPYEETTPEKVLEYVKTTVRETAQAVQTI